MSPIVSESEVRQEVLPPQSGGVDQPTLARYIREAEGRVSLALGGLPENDVVRGIVRDVAGARALMKLARTLEDMREARELLNAATDTLKDYIKQGGEGGVEGYTEGVNENAIANVDDNPLWDSREFDTRSRHLVHHDPTDFWDVWDG